MHLVGTKVWLVSNVFVKIDCGVNPIKVQFPFATIIKFNAPAHNLITRFVISKHLYFVLLHKILNRLFYMGQKRTRAKFIFEEKTVCFYEEKNTKGKRKKKPNFGMLCYVCSLLESAN